MSGNQTSGNGGGADIPVGGQQGTAFFVNMTGNNNTLVLTQTSTAGPSRGGGGGGEGIFGGGDAPPGGTLRSLTRRTSRPQCRPTALPSTTTVATASKYSLLGPPIPCGSTATPAPGTVRLRCRRRRQQRHRLYRTAGNVNTTIINNNFNASRLGTDANNSGNGILANISGGAANTVNITNNGTSNAGAITGNTRDGIHVNAAMTGAGSVVNLTGNVVQANLQQGIDVVSSSTNTTTFNINSNTAGGDGSVGQAALGNGLDGIWCCSLR